MHFEKSKSAVEIAESLKVNRNTINEDIKYLTEEIRKNWDSIDKRSWIAKQIVRMEKNRDNLITLKEEQKKEENKIRTQKLIGDFDEKALEWGAQFLENKIIEEPNEIKEDIIRKVTLYLLKDHPWIGSPMKYDQQEILRGTHTKLNCSVSYCFQVLHKMKEIGLSLFEIERGEFTFGSYNASYNLLRFSHSLGYITIAEMAKINSEYTN